MDRGARSPGFSGRVRYSTTGLKAGTLVWERNGIRRSKGYMSILTGWVGDGVSLSPLWVCRRQLGVIALSLSKGETTGNELKSKPLRS